MEGREEGILKGREEGILKVREEGKKEGILEGREEGKAEERKNMLELLEKGYTLDQIKNILSKGEIE